MKIRLFLFFAFICNALFSQTVYWNENTRLIPWRLPLVNNRSSVTYEDINGDGKPDIIRTTILDGIPVIWIDDDQDMKEGDMEGDTDNDCLLIDRNKDGVFGGPEDLSVDWLDTDGDGIADIQLVISNGSLDARYGYDFTSDYMCVIDTEKDDIKNFVDWNQLVLRCWEHNGHSNFFQDYHGNTLFLKMHASSFRINDTRYNWENPFIFYDHDQDQLSEMAIRMLDIPYFRPKPGKKPDERFKNVNENIDVIYSQRISWVSIAWDMDNDNGQGNEFDLDMTLHFRGKGFDYSDQIHAFKNLRGLPEADRFLYDPRWRQMNELIYPDEKVSYDMTFQKGEWDYCWFTFDEDDDCNRWERVELYQPLNLFKAGSRNNGLDNNQQADAVGDRGEFDSDNSGKGKLYFSPFDGRIHLYGAEWGAWRIDQNAAYFQGYGGLYPPMKVKERLYASPDSWATIKYEDTDNNGFFDLIRYDLDGDTIFEETVSLIELGIDDQAPLYDPANMNYNDFTKLFDKATKEIQQRAIDVQAVARKYGLNTSWYAFWKQPRTKFEQYSYGYWLTFYIYRDLRHMANVNKNEELVRKLDVAYYSGNWKTLY
ncbi:MAG: hypothetical protein VB102_07100 [Paludibacter sp.]|nr:hypothetical protein [Paludibacter sp.]